MTLKDRRTKSREINSELTCYLFVGFDILGQTTFEGVDWAPGDESEKFVFGFFVVVSLSGESASDPLWDVGGSLGPDLLVQVSIYSDIGGSHLDESELFDGFDGLGGSKFSSGTLLSVESFVEVDGVLPGDDLLHSGSLCFFLFLWCHFEVFLSDL